MAARLLLVAPALMRDALADRLLVADRRLAFLQRDAEAAGQPFADDAQMHFALPPQDDFVRVGVVHDRDRGILFHELVERLAELDVVLALLGRDRDREHGRIGLDFRNRRMRCLAGRQRVAGMGGIELTERHRFTGRGRGALLGRLSHQLEHAGHAAGFGFAGIERRAVADLAGQHARDRHLAAMGGVERLQHIGDGV